MCGLVCRDEEWIRIWLLCLLRLLLKKLRPLGTSQFINCVYMQTAIEISLTCFYLLAVCLACKMTNFQLFQCYFSLSWMFVPLKYCSWLDHTASMLGYHSVHYDHVIDKKYFQQYCYLADEHTHYSMNGVEMNICKTL